VNERGRPLREIVSEFHDVDRQRDLRRSFTVSGRRPTHVGGRDYCTLNRLFSNKDSTLILFLFDTRIYRYVRVACTFCIYYLGFLFLQRSNIYYLSPFKCKNCWGFQAMRTDLVVYLVSAQIFGSFKHNTNRPI